MVTEIKEPWQMTKEEMKQAVINGRYDFQGLGVRPKLASYYVAAKDWEGLDRAVDQFHGASVTIAFSKNKTIPDKVLSDYPDLKISDSRILTKGGKSAILTKERENERENDKPTGEHGVRSAHAGAARSESPALPQDLQAEGIQGVKEEQRAATVANAESTGSERLRPEAHTERRVRESGVEQGDTPGDTGERERLTPPEILSGSIPTSVPRDIILNSASDIGATAGAASRFDANLNALRILKFLDNEGRQANPQEQAILAKYSGFGDSAYNAAFSTHTRGDDTWKQRGNKKGVKRWRSRPDQMDVRGVDTPRNKQKRPTRATIDRRGKYHKQRSGMVL